MRRKAQIKNKNSKLVNSGSTMLNLACTDSTDGAFELGSIITVPGRTDSGKTILSLTTLAECANDSKFNEYYLIYDDVESKMRINLKHLFNKKTKKRIIPPPLGKSNTTLDFEANIVKAMNESDHPCIYVLDTPDALTTSEELETIHQKLLKMAKNPEDIKSITGSYHMEKAKLLHQVLREINSEIEKTDSLLIMIQQSRDKIGGGFGRKEDTAGGRAPAHYSLHRLWMTPVGKIKRKDEKIGSHIAIQLDKNHYNGKLREVTFDIYYDYGIDDLGSIIDWLINNKYWTKKGQRINAIDLDIDASKQKLISIIEEEDLEQKLKDAVQIYWNQKEDELKLNRKKRF